MITSCKHRITNKIEKVAKEGDSSANSERLFLRWLYCGVTDGAVTCSYSFSQSVNELDSSWGDESIPPARVCKLLLVTSDSEFPSSHVDKKQYESEWILNLTMATYNSTSPPNAVWQYKFGSELLTLSVGLAHVYHWTCVSLNMCIEIH